MRLSRLCVRAANRLCSLLFVSVRLANQNPAALRWGPGEVTLIAIGKAMCCPICQLSFVDIIPDSSAIHNHCSSVTPSTNRLDNVVHIFFQPSVTDPMLLLGCRDG